MKKITHHRHYQTIEKALLYINQNQQQQPSLNKIAQHCALSEFHLQRVFTEWAGVSPKQFLQYITRNQAKRRLLSGDNVLQASAASGLSSSSRLHDLLVKIEAISPGELTSQGDGLTFLYGLHTSPFGDYFIATTKRGIHQLEFINADHCEIATQKLHHQWPKATIRKDQQATAAVVQKIFNAGANNASLKMWVKGSVFQLKVWEALLHIPSGSLSSYSTIAKTIGQPSAARAVGNAIAQNSIALLIPCHRVIQQMGNLGNYRWGETRKQAILGWEAAKNCQSF